MLNRPHSSQKEKKALLLKHEEMEWRMKSHELWVALGDKNMRLFHQYSSCIGNIKSIWEMMDDKGNMVKAQNDMQRMDKLHFKEHFNDSVSCDIDS